MHDNLDYKNELTKAISSTSPTRLEVRVFAQKIGLSSEDVVPETGRISNAIHLVVHEASKSPDSWGRLLDQALALFPGLVLPESDDVQLPPIRLASVLSALERARSSVASSIGDSPSLHSFELDQVQADASSARHSVDMYLTRWQGNNDLPSRRSLSMVVSLAKLTDRVIGQIHHLRSIFDLIQEEPDHLPENCTEADRTTARLMRRREMTAARHQLNEALSRLSDGLISARSAVNDVV